MSKESVRPYLIFFIVFVSVALSTLFLGITTGLPIFSHMMQIIYYTIPLTIIYILLAPVWTFIIKGNVYKYDLKKFRKEWDDSEKTNPSTWNYSTTVLLIITVFFSFFILYYIYNMGRLDEHKSLAMLLSFGPFAIFIALSWMIWLFNKRSGYSPLVLYGEGLKYYRVFLRWDEISEISMSHPFGGYYKGKYMFKITTKDGKTYFLRVAHNAAFLDKAKGLGKGVLIR